MLTKQAMLYTGWWFIWPWLFKGLINAIHQVNHYPVDIVVCFVKIYLLDSGLSGGLHYPAFEQPRPEVSYWMRIVAWVWKSDVLLSLIVKLFLLSLIPELNQPQCMDWVWLKYFSCQLSLQKRKEMKFSHTELGTWVWVRMLVSRSVTWVSFSFLTRQCKSFPTLPPLSKGVCLEFSRDVSTFG